MKLNELLKEKSKLYPEFFVGKIFSQDKNLYTVMIENNEIKAEISGKFRHQVNRMIDYPSVGDFVLLDRLEDNHGNAIIHKVLDRNSIFVRKAAGTSNQEQVVASNIDIVFICMALNSDFNLRRLERYIAVAWDSGATPIIILTKSDLCDDLNEKLDLVENVAIGIEIVMINTIQENGWIEVEKYIKEGVTAAFIGSSGVGKSTLINKLMGKDDIKTDGLRNDDKGRHTTTKRQTILLENGAMLIDTPGMRELGIESADMSRGFSDIEEYEKDCRFSDCTHKNEPGCAVRMAIENGLLQVERFENFLKLKKEQGYEGLSSKMIEHKKLNEMFKNVGGYKNIKKAKKKMKNR